MIDKDDDLAKMPPIEPFGYIIRLLIEAGVATANGPLSWADMNGWVTANNKKLCYWELNTVKRLSACYFAAMKKFQGSGDTAPKSLVKPTEEKAVKLAKNIKSALRQVAKT